MIPRSCSDAKLTNGISYATVPKGTVADIYTLPQQQQEFGSLLESLFDTFGKNVRFGSSKTSVPKKHQHVMKKGVPGHVVKLVATPKEILFKGYYSKDTKRMLRLLR